MISFRYREKASVIHSLNPFCKLAWLVSIFVLALILEHPLYLLLLFVSTLPLVALANVWREWLSFMKYIPFLIVAIIAINALLNYNGDTVLWQAPFNIPQMGQPTINLEAIIYGLGMSLRLVTIISAFATLTLTVHPDDLMLSMIRLRLPYKSVLVTSLSTRFMPSLIDDAERIADVQRSRALELDKGRLLQRVRSRLSIMIPLLSNSLERTAQVAEAMDSRAFGNGAHRTYYKQIRLSPLDIAGLIIAFSPLAFGIFVALGGYDSYQYYPKLGTVNLTATGWLTLLALAILLSAIVPLACLKRRVDLD